MKINFDFFSRHENLMEGFWDLIAIPYIKLFTGLALAISLLNLFFSLKIKSWTGSDRMVLHYNVESGVDLIGGSSSLFIFPLLGFLILIVNFGVSLTLNKERKFAGRLLAGASLTVNLILALALVLVYFINFR